MSDDLLKRIEEHAFYESGLSAHGCFEDLDDYAKNAISKYGRILIKDIQEAFDMQTKLVTNLELEKIALQENLKAAMKYTDLYHKGLMTMIDSKIKDLEQSLKDT
jgi:hypothetical protein